MNRRSFFKTLTTAAAAFTILPSEVTYGRTWAKPLGCELFTPSLNMGEYAWVVFQSNPWRTRIMGGKFPVGAGEVTRVVGGSTSEDSPVQPRDLM